MMAKLKSLLEEIAFEQDVPKIDRYAVNNSVANYAVVGRKLYGEDIMEVAKQLVKIAEDAQSHVLSETDDWFDKVSVNRNMKSLNGMVKEFKKSATEYNQLNQRMTALYEDMGTILNRYYEINEITEDEDTKYQKFFKSALEKFGVSSPEQLSGDQKKDFFNYVDKNYAAKKETD
jgi:hypothetical protein